MITSDLGGELDQNHILGVGLKSTAFRNSKALVLVILREKVWHPQRNDRIPADNFRVTGVWRILRTGTYRKISLMTADRYGRFGKSVESGSRLAPTIKSISC